MRIILLNPNLVGRPKLRWTGEHLGLAFIASALRSLNFEVSIIDADLEELPDSEVVARIHLLAPSVVGISCCEENSAHVCSLAAAIKSVLPGTLTCIGGHYATFRVSEVANSSRADFICVGEGEKAFSELVCRFKAGSTLDGIPGIASARRVLEGTYRFGPRPAVDLDQLAPPARDTTAISMRRGFPPFVSSSRGCYGSCSFCSISAFYGSLGTRKWRAVKPTSVLAELNALESTFGAREVVFTDDNFIGPVGEGHARAADIARLLQENGTRATFSINCRANDVEPRLFSELRRAGLRKVFIGLESFSDVVLSNLRKGTTGETNRQALRVLRVLGIGVNPSVILFTPWTTVSDLREAITALERETPDFDCSLLVSHIWKLAGTPAEDPQSRRLSPQDIEDQRVAGLYAAIYPLIDTILEANSQLGLKRRTRGSNREDYDRFSMGMRGLMKMSLELLEANGNFRRAEKRLHRMWERFVSHWETVVKRSALCPTPEIVGAGGEGDRDARIQVGDPRSALAVGNTLPC